MHNEIWVVMIDNIRFRPLMASNQATIYRCFIISTELDKRSAGRGENLLSKHH